MMSRVNRTSTRRTTRSSEWHELQLKIYRNGDYLKILRRSVLDLVKVFNVLSTAMMKGTRKVQSFQAQLQELVLTVARDGVQDWKELLGAGRAPWELKELRRCKSWKSKKKVHYN